MLSNSKVREIAVDNQVFMWSHTHRYEHTDDTFISRFFFSPKDKKSMSVECFFKTRASYNMGCYLNAGFLVIKDGEEYEINFNKPKFVSEFIRFILANKVDLAKQERYRFDNAFGFLKEMGFHSSHDSIEF